jgi:hypothetical protein
MTCGTYSEAISNIFCNLSMSNVFVLVSRDSLNILIIYDRRVGRDSSVGIVTRYGLDRPGIESRRGRDFQHPSRPALGPTQPPVQWVPGHFRGKAAGAWR